MDDRPGHNQGNKSLTAALRVFLYLSECQGPRSLSDIARDCAIAPSKAHRYLASFVHMGLVKQERRSGRYDLGPQALVLGLAALARHDFVNDTADGLPDLVAATGMTALLAVWGNEAATIVRWERGASPTVTAFGLGATMPLLTSATGRVFLAYAPDAAIARQREIELGRLKRNPTLAPDITPNKSGLNALTDHIRAKGYASVDGKFIPGLVATSAPVLDWQDEAQAAVTLVGTDPELVRHGAKPVNALQSFCKQHSVRRSPSPE